ncbi:diaminopimelate decarboxylase [Sessilibacter sp. MAH1]
MTQFTENNGALFVDNLSVAELAKAYGTPLYIYSQTAITQAFNEFKNALGDFPSLTCYAVKANSNLSILKVLADLGSGFDIVSLGELERVLKAGGDPAKIVFSGVGKSVQEMKRALEVGVACFNVESEAELERLSDVAVGEGKTAKISLRVNPDVDAKTHPYISTGLKENKFGIEFNRAIDVYLKAKALPGIEIVGIDCHIGSQLTQATPFLDATDRILVLVEQLKNHGIVLKHIDLGGGLGVTYKDETPPAVADYLSPILAKLKDLKVSLMLEPGRAIVANAGILVTKVEYLKPTTEKNFAIVDAAMNDNIRPSLYQAWQEIRPVQSSDATPDTWDIVGPVCETGDFLAKGRTLAIAAGDYLAMFGAGAYCFSMSSNYNSRPRACELLVDGDTSRVIRQRESFDDIIRGELVGNA